MTRLSRILGALLALLAAPAVFADAALLLRADVQRYIDEQVATGRFARPELEAVFANVESKPAIIRALDRPSTSRPWHQFRPGFVNDRLVAAGVEFWRANAAQLARAETSYGVPPEMVAAIIGIETRYGQNMGSFRVVDALATIGFDYPRRAAFFRNELTEFLLLAKEERRDPMGFVGSYAGAMGLPQFMPSSFRKWAVDFDGDGRRDIWGSATDAIGSVANYFSVHGWIKGDDVVVPAQVTPGPQIDALVADKFNLHYTVGELKKMGVVPQAPVRDEVRAVLVPLETAPGVTEYWLGLNNFYTITRYNKSTLYAKAAQELAERIREAKYAGDAGVARAGQ
ncbi:membrane-bound lytic murein transglycosylase B [Crenobacter luteus]|uniref:Peptidoglycan N-acetylmuramoylhydrolase n=1 Tax=Crenobacter luteus TaxID=1452487 RepID=A0A161S4K7_9NEIS|nr:lytic murein transglycosylase B [Crenobacter luteus]KZE27245.1 peptidoglycan N-acetylmuramoylhydrolase [Crenobacter luteus]TCP14589.1 membrane-bound lytic murein transglycosylase B [Crenobacter luteus]